MFSVTNFWYFMNKNRGHPKIPYLTLKYLKLKRLIWSLTLYILFVV